MLTRTLEYVARPPAARRSWLLALVVLGIVGMHGLVGGSGTSAGAHHAWTAAPAAASAPAEAGHASHDVAGPAVMAEGDERGAGTALALCLVLLMALGAGLLACRAGSWPVRLRRVAARVTLPAAPLLRDSTPVPRFTVMRC
ncbi:MAG TPA: hypothetical protein VFZ64_09775 [Nocardioidaceae bacterium]